MVGGEAMYLLCYADIEMIHAKLESRRHVGDAREM